MYWLPLWHCYCCLKQSVSDCKPSSSPYMIIHNLFWFGVQFPLPQWPTQPPLSFPFIPSPQFGKLPSHITTQPHTFRHVQILSSLRFSSIQSQTILNIPSTPACLQEEAYCLIIWKEDKSVKTKVWKQRNGSVVLIRARLLWLEHFKVKSVLEWPFSST